MKKKFIYLIIAFLLFLSLFFLINDNKDSKIVQVNIDKLLETPDYNYLSKEAKEYIKNYYIENKIVINTERNKKTNAPYLNPEYIEYLNTNEKENYDIIPQELITDYISSGEVKASPSSYDLRNVNGKNLVSPLKSQGTSGLCWAFSANSILYSNLLLNNKNSYIFSERQLDYASANNGIIDNASLYDYNRNLYDGGGNFFLASDILTDGLGAVKESWDNDSIKNNEPQEISDVYNYNNSMYEVNSTIMLSKMNLATYAEDNQTRINYLNTVKEYITNYGGAWVATTNPQSKCGITIDNAKFVYNNGNCTIDHALHIIGWDDNYSYSYCMDNNTLSTNKTNCTNLVEGKGAWILKNSWGNTYPYVYLAYNSSNSEINFIKDIQVKNWDNSYKNVRESNDELIYKKEFNNQEKLNKIKFLSLYTNMNYSIYVYYNNSYNLVKTLNAKEAGFYNIDLTSNNIIIDTNEIKIKIKMEYSGLTLYCGSECHPKVFTNNTNTEKLINTSDVVYKNSLTNKEGYSIRINSNTRNFIDDTNISYKIIDSNNNEINYPYTYKNNRTYINKISTLFNLSKDMPKGTYKINTIYNNNILSTSLLTISSNYIVTEGSGTKEDPYLIKEPSQLDLIRDYPNYYYKLANDIDLTYDTTNENGLFYNNGQGWQPINYNQSFTGGFDGDYHKIKGLYINRNQEENIGLFATINLKPSNNDIYIKNLFLEDINITGLNNVGGLAGKIISNSNEIKFKILNISTSGEIFGNNNVGGTIGSLQIGSSMYDKGVTFSSLLQSVSGLYNEATISSANYAGGIFGEVVSSSKESSYIITSALFNKGTVNAPESAGLVGKISLDNTNNMYIYNSINIGKTKTNIGILFSADRTQSSTSQVKLTNVYYTNTYSCGSKSEIVLSSNTSKKSIRELKTDIYNSWTFKPFNLELNFTDNWQKEKIAGIDRIPTLKMSNFKYSKATDISLNLNEKQKHNISEYVIPNDNIEVSIENTNIAFMDDEGNIYPNSVGQTKMHIFNYHDGYENDINIMVSNDILEYNITYDNNNGNGEMSSETKTKQEKISKNLFEREGYEFTNWNTLPDGTGNTYSDMESINNIHEENANIILYAIWTPITYTLRYDANGGSGEISDEILTYDQISIIKKSTFINNGKYFVEWNTKKDGSGVSYNEEEEIKNLSSIKDSTITLYAIWNNITNGFNTNYNVEDDYINKIENNTQYNKFINEFNLENNNTIKCYDTSNNELELNRNIFTGSITKIFDINKNILYQYINVVKGDVNSDGDVDISDVAKVYNSVMKSQTFTKYITLASDVNNDKDTDISDVAKLYGYCMGRNKL